MNLTPEDARHCANALLNASKAAPVTAVKFELARRAREWDTAAQDLIDAGTEGTDASIELFGATLPGMYVWHPRSDSADPWLYVIRQLRQGGQCSLHLDTPPDPRGTYVNFHGEASPVVVQS